ncbi:hypothetical protein NliqN6_3271 [Naganishia liquefaciens]|uniref:Uncharacterized protein n=1 Tax=Naganishia liquefaciens TaxID=104408 RepID=A0A8H3TVE2_9TREE|nr:hypothetical protein NliqN6_3271 [Naganishia liquefaciens]
MMEDLISSMSHGVHVGRQGYELSALQDQLNKTLAANANTYSLTQRTRVDAVTETTAGAANVSLSHTWKPVRPQVTPTASFRGPSGWNSGGTSCNHGLAFDPRAHQMDMQSHTNVPPDPNMRSTLRQRADYSETEGSTQKSDDYSAFDEDAFAPLHSIRATAQHPSSNATDPWAGFRSRIPAAAFQAGDRNSGTTGQACQNPATWRNSAFAGDTNC